MSFLSPRLRGVILGWTLTVLGLTLAAFLLSILFVLSQFSGNAVFPADCAVVFGSAVHNTNEAGPGIQRRMQTAVTLWQEGSLSQIIVTGGMGEGNQLSEARVMRNVALRLGVEPRIISMEEGARSTWESIKFVQSFTRDCASIVSISDRYHLARIRFTAWRQGLDTMVYPAEQTAGFLFEARSVIREALVLLIYMFSV